MKRKLSYVSVIVFFAFLIVCFSGCSIKGENYMKQYMDSIDIEICGYCLTDEEYNSTRIEWVVSPIETCIQGKNILITRTNHNNEVLEENSGIRDDENYPLIIMIDGEEINITHEYLKSHSHAYNKIIKIWVDDNDETADTEQKMRIGPIVVYDNNLFIVVHNLTEMMIKNWRGQVPLTIFQFDTNDYSLKYAGYYDKYSYHPYISISN